jgi:polysaccharide export outer membrane protein
MVLAVTCLAVTSWAGPEDQAVSEVSVPAEAAAEDTTPTVEGVAFDPLNYTLGPDDVIDIAVMRHPEFSGVYPVNQEGKIQYKFVGDMEVVGLTKAELEQRIRDVLSVYVKEPEVSVTVTEYKSKYFYVLGEVGVPGKYYMRGETITVREAAFEAGLPTSSAAMRKCRLISPSYKGKPNIRKVDLYSVLYGGNLRKNINMTPGDVLYVPSTVMAKVIKVINPVASTVGIASSGPTDAGAAKSSIDAMQGRPAR